jgi:cytochrome c oxidase subunit 2
MNPDTLASHFAPKWKWWLPPGYSSFSKDVDTLFYWIFWITIVTFVLVEGALVYFCFKYRKHATRKSVYTHGSHNLEVAWTVIPAVILVALGVFSNKTWAMIKNSTSPDYPKAFQTTLKITAEQFAWNVTYPGADGKFDTDDDFTIKNQLNVPYETDKDHPEKIRIMLTSKDVIHSFFVPVLRLKQDAVPGYVGNVWFDVNRKTYEGPDGIPLTSDVKYAADGTTVVDKEEYYEVACAELCGLGHSKMRMEMRAVPRADWEKWVAQKSAEEKKRRQSESGESKPADEAAPKNK